MEPLRITAVPVAGIATDGYLPLDGFLAWAARVDRLGMGAMALRADEPLVDEPLPLARRGAGDDWYWAASCADCQWRARDVAHWNKRWDLEQSYRIDWQSRAPKVQGNGGAYKAWHQPVYLLLTDRLVWYAMGDGAAVARLLDLVPGVGKKVEMGFGALVDGFHVEPWPADWSERREGAPMRPLPLGTDDLDTPGAWYSIRPPYWRPELRRRCVLPALRLPE